MTGGQACEEQRMKRGAKREQEQKAVLKKDIDVPALLGSGKEYQRGLKDGMPICLGYFAVSFAFGIQAKAAGLTAFQAVFMSATNLTSAGQFAALGMIASGSSYLTIALAQLIVNLRYCLMSCAISQKLNRVAVPAHRYGVAYGVTDEIFGLSVLRDGPLNPYYAYGMMTVAIPGWSLGTLLGVVSGNLLPASIISALGIAIYGMFIAVVVPAARKDGAVLAVVIFAMLASIVFQAVPLLSSISSGFRIIIVTVLVAGIAAWVRPVKEEENAK